MKVVVRNQSFLVFPGKDDIPFFILNKFVTWKFNFGKQKSKPEISSKYYIYYKETHSYHFLDSALEIVIGYLKGIRANLEIIDERSSFRKEVDLKVTCGFTPRKDQSEYINHVLENKENLHRYLIDAPTGSGKGTIAAFILQGKAERIFFYMKATYIPKWVKELQFYFGIAKDEIFVIKGRESITELIDLSVEEREKIKFVIGSTSTIGRFNTEFIESGKEDDPVRPDNFLELIECDIMLVDEVHQHFDNVFMTTMMFNPGLLIGLSATLLSYDKKQMDIYNSLFDEDSRLSYTHYVPYIIYKAYQYTFMNFKGIRFKRGNYGYSHNMLETDLLRKEYIMRNYIKMILHFIEKEYYSRKLSGEKCIVFVASVDLATRLAKEIQDRYKELNIQRYVQEDKYDDFIEADISISTVLSAGTAVDIKGLITVIQTIMMDSLQANLQAFGRLREIDGRDTIYVQLHASNIKQHKRYLYNFLKILKRRAKKVVLDTYNGVI